MADVSHELGSLRHIVDTPLSSKVAMFNKQANQHQQNQLLNPFSGDSGRRSPKPSFSKDEYGKPLAGSLTEARGQKANIHVLREMLELCQIIDSEGYVVKDEPTMRVIPFGELFNIYNYISDKVVGICLRARKHKLIEFEGEMLFQRRDDDVPIFLLKPIAEIRKILNDKTDEIKRGVSPAPQATSVLIDKRSRSASPHVGKTEPKKDETAKVPEIKEAPAKIDVALPKVEEVPAKVEVAAAKVETAPTKVETTPAKTEQAPVKVEAAPSKVEVAPVKVELPAVEVVPPTVEVTVPEESKVDEAVVLEKSSSTEVTVSNVESTEVKPLETEIPTDSLATEEPNVEPPPIVITEEATEKPIASESSCSVDVESKNESNSNEDQESFVSASSSIVEISEEIVVPAEKIDENNNDTSKNEGPNDNSVPV